MGTYLRAYIDNGWKVIYGEPREIRRGAKKGLLEVQYRSGVSTFRKACVLPGELVEGKQDNERSGRK